MKHLKIKAKLLLAFALVAMLTVIVGAVGIFGLKSSDAKYSAILDKNLSGITALSDIRENFLQQRLSLRALMLDLGSPELVKVDTANLKAAESAMTAAMAAYESSITNQSAETDYFKTKDAYLGAYAAAKQKLLNAAALGDHDLAAEAFADGGRAAAVMAEGLDGTVQFMLSTVDTDAMNMANQSSRMSIIQIVVMTLSVALAMAFGIYISSSISSPIKVMGSFFARLGTSGDLMLTEEDEKSIAASIDGKDEISQCANAAVNMVNRLVYINDTLGTVANGDLTVEIEALSEKDSMGLSVIKMIDSLSSMFSELSAASGQVSSGAEQIAQGAQELASGSSQQAASVEGFSKSLDGLQEKTLRNAENSKNAAKLNEEMGTMLDESVLSMESMLEAMKGIDESSKNITRVIKVIDDIAFQTNILALNAAVEAARAGQHGKGFAVVADEVRNLASKSADAAKETALLIEGSSEKVKEGNHIVNKTNSSLEAVAASSKEIVRLIGEVSSASSEQAGAISEINRDIEQISGVVQENSASAEESAAAAEEMSTQAAALNSIVARFKLKNTSASRLHSEDKTFRLTGGTSAHSEL